MDNNQYNSDYNPYQQGQSGVQQQYYGQQPNPNPYSNQQGQFGGQQQYYGQQPDPNYYNQQQGQYGGQQQMFGQPQNQYPYYDQRSQFGMQQPYAMPVGNMPNMNLYLTLVILGFVLGVIWGALSISPYNRMKQAVAANNAAEAQNCAKKIKTIFIIGVVVNVLVLIGKLT